MIIAGISCLDYMDLYKKFIGTTKPSYSLANVAKDEELKHQKLTYRGSLTQLYKEDLSRYVEYNLVDVKVVVELDQKYDFIHLAQAVCHKGHVPYEWFQMSSRFIDGAILMYLRRHNLVAPNKPIGGREEYEEMERGGKEGFTGAFVKDPIPGLYDWVTSADITSLYPSTIMSLNISPETKMDKILNWSAMDFINGDLPILRSLNKEYTSEEFKKMIKDYNYSIASNGVIYKQDMRGVIPTILDQWFSERVEYRKKAKDFGKNGDKVQEAFYDRRQKRQKIFLNSVYGVLGLPIFRFYDRDNAEAVTTSGQEIIRSAERLVNDIYDEKYKENGVEPPTNDHVIYIDTDSVTGDSTLKLENGENINICNVFDNVDVTKEISDISGRHFKFPSNLNLPYYDEELQKVLYGKVKYIEKHKTSKKVYKLKTKTGKSIKVTEDHSLMVIENGKLVKKTAKEVKKGDKIISI